MGGRRNGTRNVETRQLDQRAHVGTPDDQALRAHVGAPGDHALRAHAGTLRDGAPPQPPGVTGRTMMAARSDLPAA
jgi:hypothetical protein